MEETYNRRSRFFLIEEAEYVNETEDAILINYQGSDYCVPRSVIVEDTGTRN